MLNKEHFIGAAKMLGLVANVFIFRWLMPESEGGVIWAIEPVTVAAGIAAVGSIIGGSQASKSAIKAAKINADAQKETNAINRKNFLESRGSQGSALLPLYFSEGEFGVGELEGMTDEELVSISNRLGIQSAGMHEAGGRDNLINEIKTKTGSAPFESTMAKDAMALYRAGGDPAARVEDFKALRDSFAPTQAAADQYVKDMFGGQMLQAELNELQPVADARLAYADMMEDAGRQNLAENLNKLESQYNRKGYAGAGSAADRMRVNEGRGIAQQGAGVRSKAIIDNAMAELATRTNNRGRTGQNLGLPGTQMGSAARMQTAPSDLAASAYNRQVNPAFLFKMGQGAPPLENAYTNTPPEASTAQLLGMAAAGLAPQLGEFYQNRKNNISAGNVPGLDYSMGFQGPKTQAQTTAEADAFRFYSSPPPKPPPGG